MVEASESGIVSRYKQLLNTIFELSSLLNTEQLQDYVVAAAVKLCNAEAAWLMLLDPIQSRLSIVAGKFSSKPQYHGFSIPVNSSLEGWVISNQQTARVDDSSTYDDRYGNVILLPGMSITSALVVPLSAKGRTIGVLEVVNHITGNFDQLDQEILEAFARQAGMGIENSHHFLQTDSVAEFVHEMRTPLSAMNTALSLIGRDDVPEEKQAQIHHIIQSEINRLTELSTSFLDYARLESGRVIFKSTQFDLVQLIQDSVDVMQTQADKKDIRIILDLPGQPQLMTGDKDKIKQVILNLLSNGIQYNPGGGKVTVSCNDSIGWTSFSVQDNGPEIPLEHLDHLFERFFRVPGLDQGSIGSGLGLTICKQIVEAHQGKISVVSQKDKGTIFTVQLPVGLQAV